MNLEKTMQESQTLLVQIAEAPAAGLLSLDGAEGKKLVKKLRALADRTTRVQTETDLLAVSEEVRSLAGETEKVPALPHGETTHEAFPAHPSRDGRTTELRAFLAQARVAQIRTHAAECRQNLERALQEVLKQKSDDAQSQEVEKSDDAGDRPPVDDVSTNGIAEETPLSSGQKSNDADAQDFTDGRDLPDDSGTNGVGGEAIQTAGQESDEAEAQSSADTREPATDVPADAVARGATLIATFYGRRDAGAPRLLHERLYRPLARTPEVDTPPDNWQDPAGNAFLRRFDPPTAQDTTIIQLALTTPGETTEAWESMRQQLQTMLQDADLSDPWWGYTLTYKAVLAPGAGENSALEELRPGVRQLRSSESLQPLARAEAPGGELWLLDVPKEGNGLAAAMVYVALGPSDREEDLMKAIYGPDAALLVPDLIAHKSYYQIRRYHDGDLKNRFEERIADLEETTNELLLSDLRYTSETEGRLADLARTYPQLTTAASRLKELHASLASQSYLYNQWRSLVKDDDIIEYHRSHLQAAVSELELLTTQYQGALELANTGVSMVQVRVDEVQESRQRRIEVLLAVIAVALSLPQIIDRTTISDLFESIPVLEPLSGNVFVELGAQIGIVLIFALLAALVVRWINRRRDRRRASRRER